MEGSDQIITAFRTNLELKTPDEELILAIDKAIEDSRTLKVKMDNIAKRNKMYWFKGTEVDLSRVHPKKAKTTSNRIFTDIETAIPIITSEPPEPEVIGQVTNDITEKLKKGLMIAYEIKYKMQQIIQRLVRLWFLSRLGVMKYRWDSKKGFVTETVITRKIGFDKRATCKENCEFMWEEMEDKVEKLIEKFPKKKKDIINKFGKDNLKSKARYFEFWGGNGEWVVWKLDRIILDKQKNPNWDWDNEDNNIFDDPSFPYILLNVFNFGDETGMYDETSVIEEAAPMQEGVNKLEQQILDLNEGQKRVWVVAGEAVSEKQAQDLVDKTGDLCVYLDRKTIPGAVNQVQSGKPDAALFNHLGHLLGEIDNIIGMHSTTRGERGSQETATGRQLLMGSDIGRLDLIVRNVEQVMEEWYNAYLQMQKVYATEAEVLSNGTETIELRAEEIPSNIKILVKKGSTLPIDKRSKMENAMKLATAGMIDPKTLFEEMGYANVDDRTTALYDWLQKTGKIQPQLPSGGMPGGVPGEAGTVPAGAGGAVPTGSPQEQQLARLQAILSSPEFKQLPPEQQQEYVGRAREIVTAIKGGQ